MLTIIGCGNSNRRDDGAGVAAVQRLAALYRNSLPDGVQVFDAGTAGMEVMFRAKGTDSLVVVDACRSGSEPGAVFEVPGSELEARPPQSYNLHDFRWDHALFAGRQIFADDFPEDVTVFLIEVADTGFGIGLTEEVDAAVSVVVGKLVRLIEWQASAQPET